jgi:hypothetical protein
MRRVTVVVLAVLGVLLILAAILLPTWVSSQFIKFPLSVNETAILQASNASYFSAATLREQTGVTVQATYTIKGDPAKGSSSVAVWDQTSSVEDITNHRSINSSTRTLAFDRRTGQLVNCCGANVNGNASIRQTGLAGYVFPFGTQKQTYLVFDTTLNRPVPFVYSGTADVGGIQTYKFVENIPSTQIATQLVPGLLLGLKTAAVRAPLFDQQHLIYYVDPVTGALLSVNQQQTVTLHNPTTGAEALVLYNADLTPTPASLSQIVALDRSGRNEIALIETTLPIVFGIVGGVALVAAAFLGFRRRRSRDDMAELDDVALEMGAAAKGDGPETLDP